MELGMAVAPTWELEPSGAIAPVLQFACLITDEPAMFKLSEGFEPGEGSEGTTVSLRVDEFGGSILSLPLELQSFVANLLLTDGVIAVCVGERHLVLEYDSAGSGDFPDTIIGAVNVLIEHTWNRIGEGEAFLGAMPAELIEETDERGEDDWPDVIG